MIIKRFLNQNNLERMKVDFKFLIDMFQKEDYIGEFDIALRNNYFNIYYQGNSLAKVDFRIKNKYKITSNSRFFENSDVLTTDDRFKDKITPCSKGNQYYIVIDKSLLHPFFQKKHINQFASNIRKIYYNEEYTKEQSIMTDNLDREDFISIDRQVMGGNFPGRLDLLALQRVDGNKYNFLVIEMKLGRNRDLNINDNNKNNVVYQLNRYTDYIDKYFDDFKICYEKNYEQKKELGLIKTPDYRNVDIVKPVKGIVLVVGYSGIAKSKIEALEKKYHKDLKIGPINYKLDLTKLLKDCLQDN